MGFWGRWADYNGCTRKNHRNQLRSRISSVYTPQIFQSPLETIDGYVGAIYQKVPSQVAKSSNSRRTMIRCNNSIQSNGNLCGLWGDSLYALAKGSYVLDVFTISSSEYRMSKILQNPIPSKFNMDLLNVILWKKELSSQMRIWVFMPFSGGNTSVWAN